jgi:hypothetical protein
VNGSRFSGCEREESKEGKECVRVHLELRLLKEGGEPHQLLK